MDGTSTLCNFGGLPCYFGSRVTRSYAPNGQPGDTQTEHFPFPASFASDNVVVIASANQDKVPFNANAPAVVAMAWSADHSGFSLRTRNSDITAGTMAFDWLALDISNTAKGSAVNMKALTLSPAVFAASGVTGDWALWNLPVSFPGAGPLGSTPIPLVSLVGASTLPDSCLPIVGVATNGSNVRARNSDIESGVASLSCLGIIDTAGGGNYFAQAGTVPVAYFRDSGEKGDRQNWAIYFPVPFSGPPLVFVTANNLGAGTNNAVAAVGTAVEIRSTGFELVARNSDTSKGFAGFNWVAIGCRGCW